MLSFLNAIVELVDMRDGQVLFRSNKAYEIGKKVSVRMVLPPGSGKIANISVVIVSSRELENGGTLYVSQLTDEVLAEFSSDFSDKALRRASRHHLGIRVMCKQLPGFWGMTVDLSRTGLQLELDGPVAVGQLLEMRMEFDRFDLPTVNVEADVRWCRANGDKYRAGVQFRLQDPKTKAVIDQVADFFEHRSQADLETLLHQAKLTEKTSEQSKPAPTERRKARRTTFVIPVDATILGHRWELRDKRLVISLRDKSGEERRLDFPDCQTLRDYGCAYGITAKSMRTCSDSPLLDWVAARNPGSWKHYEFLDISQQVILEIVSAPCRPG